MKNFQSWNKLNKFNEAELKVMAINREGLKELRKVQNALYIKALALSTIFRL